MNRATGFGPVFDGHSVLLILGSFPSVKSRREGFYYGNPQNRFWRTVCSFFGEPVPPDVAGKRAFLLRRNIALWDVVTECEIEGSADASIRGAVLADLPALLQRAPIGRIYCNGGLAYRLLEARFPACLDIAMKLPSTSPANPRFSEEVWFAALAAAFPSVAKTAPAK